MSHARSPRAFSSVSSADADARLSCGGYARLSCGGSHEPADACPAGERARSPAGERARSLLPSQVRSLKLLCIRINLFAGQERARILHNDYAALSQPLHGPSPYTVPRGYTALTATPTRAATRPEAVTPARHRIPGNAGRASGR